MPAWLQYRDQRHEWTSVTLGDQPVTLGGRDGIRVAGSTVTRRHARVLREADGYWIEPLRGTVFVNEVEVTRHRLVSRDLIRVAELELEFWEDRGSPGRTARSQ